MNERPLDLHGMPAAVELAPPHPDLRAVVVIPARDEAPRIAACLHALASQRDMAANSYEVIAILDGCSDDTLGVIQQNARLHEQLAIHTVTLSRPQGVGRARRLGMDIACRRLMSLKRADGLIASSDADTTVAGDWLSVQLALSRSGAAAIGGLIELDPTERDTLDPHALAVRELGATTRLAFAVQQTAGGELVEHPHFSGASLALTAAAYERCGGLPVRAALEDEALAHALTRQGIAIHRPRHVRVRTSARTDGRAPRGLAQDLTRADWRARRSYNAGEFPLNRLLAVKQNTIALLLPAREVAKTIGPIARTAARLKDAGLLDEVLVIDAASQDETAAIARQAGLHVAQEDELLADYGPSQGKGDAMWRGLAATSSEIVAFADTDTEDFHDGFLLGVLGPLLCDLDIQLVKGTFRRPFRNGDTVLAEGGGRVTELMARPLLNLHAPQLAVFDQPLAGETAFMACAHAKFTAGEAGVCLATSGPGAIHLLNGLYDAKLDHQPVVAIIGQQARLGLGGNYQQEVDLPTLYKDVAHEYVQMATEPGQIRHLIDRAMRIALSERTVTCVIVPNDLQMEPAVPTPPHAHGTVHSGPGYTPPNVTPNDEQLRRAAVALNAGERVAMLIGAGALHATQEVIEVADTLGAGVAKALLGKAAVPDDLPFVTGSIGLLGTRPSWDMMQDCDTLLMVGSSFPYSEFLPEEGQARGVQIDLDGRMLGIRYPMEVNLVGDSALTLKALLPLLQRKDDRGWREKIEKNMSEWWQVIEKRAHEPAKPVNPQLIFHELSKRLPDRAILTSDSGSAANWYARDVRLRAGMMATLSGTLATMGPGVPYAIAAKFAHPDRPVIALVGDGAMQMNGLAELITIAKYRERWSDQRLIVLVLNNRDLNQVTWEQRAMSGDPKFVESQELPDVPYARWAEMLGLNGIRTADPEAIGECWDQALAADRPTVFEVCCDPEVPPLPPHITIEQARSFASAILHGDPGSRRIIAQALRQKLPEFRPGR